MTKRKTDEQVTEFFQKLVTSQNRYKKCIDVKVTKKPGRAPRYSVKVSEMYEYPLGLSFVQLKEISEFFGTDKIDIDRYSYGGCDTCDYGSSYELTLEIG